jgi:cytoskeleton protein RodZ
VVQAGIGRRLRGGRDMRGRVGTDGEWDWVGGEVSTARPSPVIDDVDAASAEAPRVPTLGEALCAERERQGLGLDQIEAGTRIRVAQLRAIEDDRLDALPAEAYARGFVRTYADQLGIDADATVHLFNQQWSRLHPSQAEGYSPLRPPVAAADDAARPLGAISLVLALVLLIGSATMFVLRGDHGSGHAADRPPLSHTPSSATTNLPPGTTQPPPAAATRTSTRITIVAAAGACWLEARLGSSTGRLLVERTLAPGESVRLHGRRIWLRLGDPTNIRLRLNGQPLKLTPTAQPINLLVTRHGATAA